MDIGTESKSEKIGKILGFMTSAIIFFSILYFIVFRKYFLTYQYVLFAVIVFIILIFIGRYLNEEKVIF